MGLELVLVDKMLEVDRDELNVEVELRIDDCLSVERRAASVCSECSLLASGAFGVLACVDDGLLVGEELNFDAGEACVSVSDTPSLWISCNHCADVAVDDVLNVNVVLTIDEAALVDVGE